MAVFTCRVCGGALPEIIEGRKCVCEFCGSEQVVPSEKDQAAAEMFNRAAALRRNNEFDLALQNYEKIIELRPEESEAYWGAMLCRFGIEYVEDPYGNGRMPTLRRMQTVSILEDPYYLNTIKYADPETVGIYEQEAHVLDRIQRKYGAIARKTEPYDIFISYKETDGDGRRTEDYAYAQEIYTELTKQGYRVFFSHISLEDKQGENYEPYIFAALTSARVMILVGTTPEHITSPWVMNEWSRFRYLMNDSEDRYLILVYKGMSLSEAPEVLLKAQALDYGKVGALQDLARGVDKLFGRESGNLEKVQAARTDKLLRQAEEALKAGQFDQADRIYQQAMETDETNPQVYLGRVLCACRLREEAELAASDTDYTSMPYWKQALSVSTDEQKARYRQYAEQADAYRRQKSEESRWAGIADRIRAAGNTQEIEACGKEILKVPEGAAREKLAALYGEAKNRILEQTYQALVDQAGRTGQNGSMQDWYWLAKQFHDLGGYRESAKLEAFCMEAAKKQESQASARELEAQQKEAKSLGRERGQRTVMQAIAAMKPYYIKAIIAGVAAYLILGFLKWIGLFRSITSSVQIKGTLLVGVVPIIIITLIAVLRGTGKTQAQKMKMRKWDKQRQADKDAGGQGHAD